MVSYEARVAFRKLSHGGGGAVVSNRSWAFSAARRERAQALWSPRRAWPMARREWSSRDAGVLAGLPALQGGAVDAQGFAVAAFGAGLN
ncbi:hypothetical protein [Streptomyces anulatus]|uniref:hypothetical protein n=1 Tax=Streptomyces anulatus TaxID=1892 RepID=UPI00365FAB87